MTTQELDATVISRVIPAEENAMMMGNPCMDWGADGPGPAGFSLPSTRPNQGR